MKIYDAEIAKLEANSDWYSVLLSDQQGYLAHKKHFPPRTLQ
jgi:hypothetical protein